MRLGRQPVKSVITFEELYRRLPEAGVPIIMREAERSSLLAALRYGEANAQETVDFLLGNISKRMAEQYREELAEMPEFKAKGRRACATNDNLCCALACQQWRF